MANELVDTTYDKRLITRNLENGTLTKKQLEKTLANLPDQEENSEPVDLGSGEAPKA